MTKIIIPSAILNQSENLKFELRNTKNSLTETLQSTSIKRKRGRPRKNNNVSIAEMDKSLAENGYETADSFSKREI